MYSGIPRVILPIMGCLIFYPVLYVHTTKNKKNPAKIPWEITENGPIIRRQISPLLVAVDTWVHCVVCCCCCCVCECVCVYLCWFITGLVFVFWNKIVWETGLQLTISGVYVCICMCVRVSWWPYHYDNTSHQLAEEGRGVNDRRLWCV